MNRREFILGAGSATLLAGCVPQNIRQAFDTQESNGPKIIGGSWEENSRIAKGIFESIQTGHAPINEDGLAYSMLPARKQFRKVSNESPQRFNYRESIAYAAALTEYFAAMSNARRELGLTKGDADKTATGLKMNSHTFFTFEEKGYCMDPGLSAPGRGELMRMVPAMTLIAEEMQPLYRAVLRKGAIIGREGDAYRSRMQQMLWMIRAAGTDNPYANIPADNEVRSLMNGAFPNGFNVWNNYHRKTLNEAKAMADLGNLVSRLLGGNEQFSTRDFINQGNQGQRLVQQQMQNAINTPVMGQIYPGSEYSLIGPGVAVRAVGTAPLAARIEMINVGGQNFHYEPSEWAAETRRQAQRVGFSGAMQSPKIGSIKSYANSERGEADQAMLSAFGADISKLGVERLAEHGPNSKVLQSLFKTGAGVTPVLGNALSLYEASTGKDWLTGDDLSTASRALAMAGTIPGANVLNQLSRSTANSVLGNIARNASGNFIPRLADRTDFVRDIAGWATSDTASAAINRMNMEPEFQRASNMASSLFRSFA